MYLIDTNVVSEARRGAPEALSWLRSVDPKSLHLSFITLGEIMRGIPIKQKSDPLGAAPLAARLQKLHDDHADRILGFTDQIAIEWGRIAALSPRGDADGLIATAIVHDLINATHNVKDFDDTPASVINPWGCEGMTDDLDTRTSLPSRSSETQVEVTKKISHLPAHLEKLAGRARDYAKAASSKNTRRAYNADWRHYETWCRRQDLLALPPDPQVIGLYLSACASGAATADRKASSVATIERRLSALVWHFRELSEYFDRTDRHVATVLAGIRNTHAKPPQQKEAVLPADVIAMLETLDRGTLRGLRDRAMLLIGFAGGLRRSEITGLDCGRDHTEDGSGWVEILDKGMVVTLRGKTGWREVEIGRGSSDATCPIVALETWLKFARIGHGPLFRRVTRKGRDVGPDRLNDREVARLVKRAALAAGVRGDLSEGERKSKFAGHSLRAGLASSAEADERYVQKQLGHASAEMTRRYQRRRDRFRVNLTKAVGL